MNQQISLLQNAPQVMADHTFRNGSNGSRARGTTLFHHLRHLLLFLWALGGFHGLAAEVTNVGDVPEPLWKSVAGARGAHHNDLRNWSE